MGLEFRRVLFRSANNGVTMNAIDHTTYHYAAAPVSVTEVERPEEKVYVAEGVIYLNEVKAVMLFTATGALVYSGETDRVEVSQGGVYLLRTAQGITTVMVW